MGFIQESGSAAGTSCTSGQKVAPSASDNAGSLLLLRAQVGAHYDAHGSPCLTVGGFGHILSDTFWYILVTTHISC